MRRCEESWIQTYLDYTANSKPPEIYHKWMAISVIAGALQRKVGIQRSYFKIFPNQYIVLVGPPGTGKTTAMTLGTNFLEKIGRVHFTAQSASRAALIGEMMDSLRAFDNPDAIIPDNEKDKKKFTQSAVTARINELSALLATDQINMIEFLTDIYDYTNRKWEHSTRGHGKETIFHPCLNLISSTTQKRLIELIPKSAIEGGFVSRTLFIYAEAPRKVDPFYEFTEREHELAKKLDHDLKEISELSGEYCLTEEAMDFFRGWSMEFDMQLRDESIEGFLERKPAHLMKLAMLLSAAMDNSKIIEMRHFDEALLMLNEAEPLMIRAFKGAGNNKKAADMARILTQIRSQGVVDYGELLESNVNNVNLTEFDDLIQTLILTKAITVDTSAHKKIIRAKK